MLQPFYASSEINRHSDYRNDENFLKKIMMDPRTKFIPVYNGKNLFKGFDQNINAIKFDYSLLKKLLPNVFDITYNVFGNSNADNCIDTTSVSRNGKSTWKFEAGDV